MKRKIYFIIFIVLFILVLINIKEIDIYDHKMIIFIKGRGEAYLLNPITIKTEFGNIYLKRFAKIGWPYIFSDFDYRTRLNWHRIKLSVHYMGKSIDCDLNLLGQKIEVKDSIIELSGASINISSMRQPIIINGRNEILLQLLYIIGSQEMTLMLWSAPPFYMTTTLDGEVLEINSSY